MAKKEAKKKNLKLRRRIRKTGGVVCLITSLLVAAIPVPKTSAATETTKYTWDTQIAAENKSVIPLVPANCNTIYTTRDGMFQFAFVPASETDPNMIAVILGCNVANLPDHKLTIPDTVEAYTKLSENQGTRSGYVAVGRNYQPLYYLSQEEVYETDVSGNDILVSPAQYSPCYARDYDIWYNEDLTKYYYIDSNGEFQPTDEQTEQWIRDVEVRYIGNQYLVANTSTSSGDGAIQEWVIATDSNGKAFVNTDKDKGVFANQANIFVLDVGENLVGIGNYSFYNCSGLKSISLGNGLTEVGKYAFAQCYNMNEVGFDAGSNIQYISDYTFQGCRALTSFILPASVKIIYDHAFEGCTGLGTNGGTVDLIGANSGMNTGLYSLGYNVFKNCSGLQSLTLPESMDNSLDSVHLNNFAGCTALKHITALSPYTTFMADTDSTNASAYTVENFLADVPNVFYFEAEGDSRTHDYTRAHAIAFKYSDRDCYEIITKEKAIDPATGQETGALAELLYQVDSQNNLLTFNMSAPVKEVTIPSAIGPNGVSTLDEGSFSGNCFLEKITIPATVTKINSNAFRGCHNLRDVIFENAASISYIGSGAFATQQVDGHQASCSNPGFLSTVKTPVLTFTGTVGAGIVPYDYAMNAANFINAGEQTRTYITYYSGWPTNLEIQYKINQETGVGAATLVDYPTFPELKDGNKYTAANYPYITSAYEDAASTAISKYETWKIENPKITQISDYEWQIINSALEVTVPKGVKALDLGLFSGVTGVLDENGDYKVVSVGSQAASADVTIQKITLEDITEIAPYTFDGCKSLTTINITGGAEKIDPYAFASSYMDPTNQSGCDSALTTVNMTGGGGYIGDYAFNNNKLLTQVTLSAGVAEMGLRPFRDCPNLEDVNFSGSPNFVTEKAIIYGLENGNKVSVIECLESRGRLNTTGSVLAAEIPSTVTQIMKEAFMDCEDVGSMDLSESSVARIPENAFRNTQSLYSIKLPNTCKTISKDAFYDSNVRYVEIPSSVNLIDPKAFNTQKNGVPEYASSDIAHPYYSIEFYAEPETAAAYYAEEYDNISLTDMPPSTTFRIIFYDWDGAILKDEDVTIYSDATAPADPVREGYRFIGWLPADFTNVSRSMDITAQYEKIDSEELKYTVTFIDYDDTVLYTQRVAQGEDAILPKDPAREGYTFTGWRPAITDIAKDTETYAQYEKITDGSGTASDGSNTGTGNGNNNNGSGSGNGTVSGNGTSTLYTLTVRNGSGSGSYVAGATVIILANEPAANQEFLKWTQEGTADLKMASTTISATTMVMPAENVTVTANYANKPTTGSGSTANAGSGGSGSGTNGTISGGNGTGGTTTVVIDKNGLSNTSVVSVVVKGSSDNFVLKISEDSTATESIIRALMAEYGSLDNLKYFPMDITLYDSTGNRKITDTSGLSISITLPLPDSMIPYAGNNRIAAVKDDKLEKLSPKFTTIDGVSCITFTAEHFSPYVIYVNTEQLESVGVTDNSPKTGDLEPKWFIALGLAAMGVLLFMKKDKTGRKTALA